MEHTPGPWKLVKTEAGHLDVQPKTGGRIARVSPLNGNGHPMPNAAADAQLIAAAPDLLQACKRLVAAENWEQDWENGDSITDIKNAVELGRFNTYLQSQSVCIALDSIDLLALYRALRLHFEQEATDGDTQAE